MSRTRAPIASEDGDHRIGAILAGVDALVLPPDLTMEILQRRAQETIEYRRAFTVEDAKMYARVVIDYARLAEEVDALRMRTRQLADENMRLRQKLGEAVTLEDISAVKGTQGDLR